jgi:hypothetical protein
MLPSSTSSSDTSPSPRRWGRFALIVLLLLAGIEVALRFPQVRSALPPRTHYYHPAITTRLDAVERIMSENSRVDVLFIGSSIVLTNLHPGIFDAVLPQPHGAISFNAGLPGLWPTSVHLYAEHVWLPTARPRLVVQGIRYPELATDAHAKYETQVWTGKIEPSWRDPGFWSQLSAKMVAHVHLLQYRGVAVTMLQRYRNGWVDPDAPESEDPYATRGFQAIAHPSDTPMEDWEADLPNEGVCEQSRCEVGFAALERTIAAVRASGAEYVLLNVPEHASRWRGPGGIARYQHYLEQLRAFAEREGVMFIDPTEGDPFRFDRTPYADFAHMTEVGSRQFTRAVAEQMGPLLAAVARPKSKPAADVVGLAAGPPSTP